MLKVLASSVVVAMLAVPLSGVATADPGPSGPSVVQSGDVSAASARTPKPKVTVAKCTPRKKPARGYPAAPQAQSAAARAKQTRMLSGSVYFAPRAALSLSRFTMKDRKGCVVARGVTTRTGGFAVPFRKSQLPLLPLTVTVRGGKVAGTRFKGVMRARAFQLGRKAPVVQVSLVSSAASKMASKQQAYTKSSNKVMRSLGFKSTALPWALQFRNSVVGYRQLARQVRATKGGFDAVAAKAARKAQRKKPMRGLKPASAMDSGPKQVAQSVSAAEAADTSVCDVPVPDTGYSASDEVVSNVAAIGIGGLLEYAGAATTSAEGITGMLLSPLGADDETTVLQSDVNAVFEELTCISDQMSYLSHQIAYMQYTIDISAASQCASDVNNYYYDYYTLLQNASTWPINAQNQALMGDLPEWKGLNTTCAQDVNNALFGTAGGQASAWQQLNQNYSSGVEWYTQVQVQALQANLQYWGQILYYAFILENEYDNFYGNWEDADTLAGGDNPTGDSPVCDAGATYTTPTYCVYQANVTAAFPADLYSDEIGIISSGTGVNAVPGGMIAYSPYSGLSDSAWNDIPDTNANANGANSPTAMTGPWWYNIYLTTVEYSPNNYSGSPPATMYANGQYSCGEDGYTGGCLPTGMWDWAYESAQYFNDEYVDPDGTKGQINPNGYGTAVQTFWNPQNTTRTSVTWSDVSELAEEGPPNNSSTDDLMTAEEVFYDAINQTPSPYPSEYEPGGAWSQFSESSASYWTDDTTSWIKMQVDAIPSAGEFQIQSWIGAPLGNTSGWTVKNQNSIPNTPIIAYLSGRTWWPESAEANTFIPPTPPTS